jgi:hypothetical protein
MGTNNNTGSPVWDTRTTLPGVYAIELQNAGKTTATERLVVKP